MPRYDFEIEAVYEILTFPLAVEAANWEEARDKVVAYVDNRGGPRPRPTKLVFRSIKKNGTIFDRRERDLDRDIVNKGVG